MRRRCSIISFTHLIEDGAAQGWNHPRSCCLSKRWARQKATTSDDQEAHTEPHGLCSVKLYNAWLNYEKEFSLEEVNASFHLASLAYGVLCVVYCVQRLAPIFELNYLLSSSCQASTSPCISVAIRTVLFIKKAASLLYSASQLASYYLDQLELVSRPARCLLH